MRHGIGKHTASELKVAIGIVAALVDEISDELSYQGYITAVLENMSKMDVALKELLNRIDVIVEEGQW